MEAPFVHFVHSLNEMWLVILDERGLVKPLEGPLPIPRSWSKHLQKPEKPEVMNPCPHHFVSDDDHPGYSCCQLCNKTKKDKR